jgi:hypothetical protein
VRVARTGARRCALGAGTVESVERCLKAALKYFESPSAPPELPSVRRPYVIAIDLITHPLSARSSVKLHVFSS